MSPRQFISPLGSHSTGADQEGRRGRGGRAARYRGKPRRPCPRGAIGRLPSQPRDGVRRWRWGRSCARPVRLFQASPPRAGALGPRSRRLRSAPARRGTGSGAGAGTRRAGGGRCGLGSGTELPGRARLFPLPARPRRVVSPGSREETERSGSTARGPQSSDRAEQSRVAPPEHGAATLPGRLCPQP